MDVGLRIFLLGALALIVTVFVADLIAGCIQEHRFRRYVREHRREVRQ